jgi:two-component system, OmpR family, flagellar system response regulator FtcR
MIVLIDEREIVVDSYKTQLKREGFASAGFNCSDFKEWADTSCREDLGCIGAYLVGAHNTKNLTPKYLRQKTDVPIIALVDSGNLESTLSLFETGYDDVLSKPVHVREILARITAIKRRGHGTGNSGTFNRLKVFVDGRDPEVDGSAFVLPRRERRILEYLASINGRRVNKTQIFNAIYGVFDENVDENVVESHICKLRKKLRMKLGVDIIDSKRFLGYRLAIEPSLISVSA